jgi:lysophospholipase L1-like esterase
MCGRARRGRRRRRLGARATTLAIATLTIVFGGAVSAHAAWQTTIGNRVINVGYVTVTPQGNVAASSWAGCNSGNAYATDVPQVDVLSAADGHALWSVTESDSHPYNLRGCDPRPLFDAQGNFYGTGFVKGDPNHPPSYFLVSYSATGAFRWATPVPEPIEGGSLSEAVVGADGNVYIYNDFRLTGYNSSTGAALWSAEVPNVGGGRGLYADASGLTVATTIRFSYGGQLVHPDGNDGDTGGAPVAQEPGGAVYTARVDLSKCSGSTPSYTIEVKRWTLSGVQWTAQVKTPHKLSSASECSNQLGGQLIMRAYPAGGVILEGADNWESTRHTDYLIALNSKGKTRWARTISHSDWQYGQDTGTVVTTAGEIATVQYGRTTCPMECGIAEIEFFDGETGAPSRPPVILQNSDPNSPTSAYEPVVFGTGDSLAISAEKAYLPIEIDEVPRVIAIDVPGLATDYNELLRADYGGPIVTSVSPKRGLAGGGTTVTIKGSNFLGVPKAVVRFGGVEAPSVTVNSGTSITAASPKNPSGTVDVTVTTPVATSPVSSKDHFTYEPYASYVALGDSFASGLGSFSYLTGTTKGQHPCYRATKGYVEQLAGVTHDTLAFPGCQGSTIGASDSNGTLNGGAAPQVNQLSRAARLVTLSIGGNDVGFPQVIASCVEGPLAFGSRGCATTDEPRAKQALEWLERGRPAGTEQLPGIDPKTGQTDSSTDPAPVPSLRGLYETIAALAPNARILVVGYPHLFGPESGLPPGDECPVGNTLPYAVSGPDIAWLNNEADEIDAIIDVAAKAAAANTRHDIRFVDPRGAFAGHGICDSGAEYLNYLRINIKKQEAEIESFHPNVEGQNALATLLETSLP